MQDTSFQYNILWYNNISRCLILEYKYFIITVIFNYGLLFIIDYKRSKYVVKIKVFKYLYF